MRGYNWEYFKGWSLIGRLVRDEGRSFSGREAHCCFLNSGGERFAHTASVTGLDYIDDGRAASIVDWDLDGDLDIWTSNRTGPRVRYLQNNAGNAQNFVAFNLTGTTSNRDAIGARLEVKLPGDDKLSIKTLRAGDGFLSQSSKSLHFGVGQAEQIEQLIVRWPDGSTEQFADLPSNHRYRVVQGTASIEPWTPDREEVRLASSRLSGATSSGESRVVIPLKRKLPSLPVATLDGQLTDARDGIGSRTTLVNLWQTTCIPCMRELAEFSQEADRIRDAGADIVAIHLSDPKSNVDDERTVVQDKVDQLGLPFQALIAVDDCTDRLNDYLKEILQRHLSIELPTSLLVGADLKTAVVYKGPVMTDTLLADLPLVEADENERLTASLPFPGKWLNSPLVERPEDEL